MRELGWRPRYGNQEMLIQSAVLVFVAFCLASSMVYVLSDLLDRAEDRAHPVRRGRALAAGRVGGRGAGRDGSARRRSDGALVLLHEAFLVTVLPMVFGIVRYMMLVLVRERREDPDELLTRDGPLVLAILVWAALSIAVLYLERPIAARS